MNAVRKVFARLIQITFLLAQIVPLEMQFYIYILVTLATGTSKVYPKMHKISSVYEDTFLVYYPLKVARYIFRGRKRTFNLYLPIL